MQWSLFVLILMGQCVIFTCHLYEYHFIRKEMSRYEAQSYCREHFTDLATVSNMRDMERMRNSSQTTGTWIGLHMHTKRGGNKPWRWSLPGVEYKESEALWENGEPKDSENCVEMDENDENDDCKWDVESCAEDNKLICYNDKVILIKEKKTWDEALDYCRAKHRDLVSITDRHQQRWVEKRAKMAETAFVWLGMRYTCTLDLWFWVTMKKEGKWYERREGESLNFICAL
ncbi:hypothetical protein KUCAC02_000676 [Chaenocephalus aceratus]|uniref:Uncharacterized protein n=1 Tax=Chaenocephalus aceratus TaxID=36190 RepID=A0ACB9W774_CHAAC|nr:hypothetical protein KUCAC02_000676 [Chaenocephalus aceratus]